MAKKPKGPKSGASEDGAASARALVESFIGRMYRWEVWIWNESQGFTPTNQEQIDRHNERVRRPVIEIFRDLCTARDRKYGNPAHLSYGKPSSFEDERVTEVAVKGKQILVYTFRKSTLGGGERCYFIRREADAWKIDGVKYRPHTAASWRQAILGM